MSTFSFLNVCLMLLCVLRRHTVCSTNAITCDAGPYVLGEPASVSCNLHEDMTECKLSVFIERFRPNEITTDPGTEIVACRWEETAHDHTCSVENGYRFNDAKGDHPTLEIPSLDNSSVGFYMCYVMPPQNETKTHVCKLTPISRPVKPITLSTTASTSTTPTGNNQCVKNGRCETSSVSPVLIVVVVFALIIILVLVVYIGRRRIKRFVCGHRRQQKEDVEMKLASRQLLIPSNPRNVEWTMQRTTAHTNTRIEAYLKDFRLESREYERMISLLERAMQDKHTQMSSTVPRSVSNERDTSNCLVVVLESSTLKIVLFNMQGLNIDGSQAETYTITSEIRQGIGEQLLIFITNSITDFVSMHNLSGQRMPLGFVISFPCKHDQDNWHDLTTVQLTKWTKGFGREDLVRKNLDEILQDALRNNVNCDLEIKVIINNAVDMLVSTAHQNSNSKIKLVLGDGLNACYVNNEKKVYTTTECGSFGDGGCLELYRTDFDRDLDNNSMYRGEHIMEKMVSMVYLGELVRLVLVKLTKEKLLFKSVARGSVLYKADSFKASFMPLVERDTDGKFQRTECVLGMLEVDSYTEEDCETVQHVCRLISERAAHLAATVVAALVKHVQQPEITIAIDESVYGSHPRFHQLMIQKTIELVGEGSKVNIQSFSNESGRGAALLAAMAT